jgi:hypothetical protein
MQLFSYYYVFTIILGIEIRGLRRFRCWVLDEISLEAVKESMMRISFLSLRMISSSYFPNQVFELILSNFI